MIQKQETLHVMFSLSIVITHAWGLGQKVEWGYWLVYSHFTFFNLMLPFNLSICQSSDNSRDNSIYYFDLLLFSYIKYRLIHIFLNLAVRLNNVQKSIVDSTILKLLPPPMSFMLIPFIFTWYSEWYSYINFHKSSINTVNQVSIQQNSVKQTAKN